MSISTPKPSARVLFIDDDPDHLSLVQRLVELQLGVLVDVVTTSAGAERRLNEHCYDVVICDVSLDGELGTAICARLLEYDPGQPLLLLTNYDGLDSVVSEAGRLGVPIYPKIDVVEDKFLTLLRRLLAVRPCSKYHRHDNKPAKESDPPPIRLTLPHVAAARACARALISKG